MEFPDNDQATDVLYRATHNQPHQQPPKDVMWALYSLVRHEQVTHVVGRSQQDDGATKWTVTALIPGFLVRIEAEAGVWQWNWDSESPESRTLDAKILALRDLTELRVARLRQRGESSAHVWQTDLVAVFGESEIALPSSIEPNNHTDRAAAEDLALALRDAFTREANA